MSKWIDSAVFYHIYTLGFCGAPKVNNEEELVVNRIAKVIDWIPHFKDLGVNAIYFGPLFESTSHGYDTIDYTKIDKRLGTNDDFKAVCKALHKANIKVILDGVFNHVGRDFIGFKDLQKNKWNSKYKDWFQNVNFDGRSPYGDEFWYEGWEGHFNLVKLNLKNPEVVHYIFSAIEGWIKEFEIDGLRLDVAYCMDQDFFRGLRQFVDSKKEDFWLMGEMVHGDYRRLVAPELLNSSTNYECYKGIYSSHNDKNYFEINHSLNRLFAQGGLYQGFKLYNFIDNHDVTRIGSILKNKKHIENVYTLLFTMPGIPSIYYGSEWMIEGEKGRGSDDSLRPELELKDLQQKDDTLIKHIKKLSEAKSELKALSHGDYKQVIVKNEQLVYERSCEDENVYVALNLADQEETLSFKVKSGVVLEDYLDDKKTYNVEDDSVSIKLPAYTGKVLVVAPKEKETV